MLTKPNIFRRKLKNKLLLIFAIILLYTMFVIIFFGYGSYRKLMIDKSLSYSMRNSQELASALKEKAKDLDTFTRTILYDNRIYSFNRQIILSQRDIFFQYQFATDVDNYLNSILFSKDEFISIGFKFKENAYTYVRSRLYTMNADVLSDIDNIYASGLKGKGKPVWYVSNIDNQTRIYITKEVFDINTMEEIGVFIFRIDPDTIFKPLANMCKASGQNIYIYDNSGHKLFSYISFQPQSSSFYSDLIKLKPGDEYQRITTSTDNIYAYCTSLLDNGFKFYICDSSNSILKEVNKLSIFLFFLFLLTIPIVLALINYFQLDIIKPLNLLVSKMKKIEDGEIGTTIDSTREDEIGYVFKTFNKMSQEIKVLIDSVYREQIAQKEEENKALQAQINPHFLYNTLEAINWKARIKDVPEICEMVTALSYIMEANMNRNNERLITIRKEIEYINNYKFIIEQRFNNKHKFSISVAENVLDCKIPKLIILPLIENAVYHGLEMKKGEGLITLEIAKIEDTLMVTVSDDGLGIDKEQLNKITQELTINIDKLEDRYEKSHNSIGLINVHKRIKLLYGNEYGLEISSVLDKGTRVTIHMPIIEEGC